MHMDNSCDVTPKPKNLKEFFTSWFLWKPLIAIVAGGIAGFVIFYLISCTSGICTITESTYSTILTGSLFGLLITNSPCLKCVAIKNNRKY